MSQPAPSITAAELAKRVGGRLHGDPHKVLRAVATLDDAGPDAVSWLGDERYLPRLAKSKAAVVLVPEGCALPSGMTAIAVADPDLALCEALAALAPPTDLVPPGVDATARVAPDAVVEGACIGPHVFVGSKTVVGHGTQVHAGVYLGSECQIGPDCVLWPNVVVRERSTLGRRVIVHPNTTIGADGFGYHQRGGRHVKVPQIGRVVIEDDVEIGANSCVDRARSGETRIGRGTKIDNLVQIGHNVRVGNDCIIVSQCGISGSTTLGHHVVLAGQVGVADHTRIGDNVVVAAMSGVRGDVKSGKTLRGIPSVDNADFARQTVAVYRLPKMIEEFRALRKRVEKLESAADDSTRG